MSKTKGFLLAVAVATTAFTLSCSSGDDGGGTSSNSNIGTCGGKEYDTTTYSCKDGELVGSCRGERYYPSYEYCDNGVIKNLSSSSDGGSSSSVGGESSSSSEGTSSSSSLPPETAFCMLTPDGINCTSSPVSLEECSSLGGIPDQVAALSVNGNAGAGRASICLNSSCGNSCGNEIAGRLAYYLQSRAGTTFDLDQTKDYCQASGDVLTCYSGIEINLKAGSIYVNAGGVKGLAAGSYTVYVKTKDNAASPLQIISFAISEQSGGNHFNPNISYIDFIDNRDGKTYKSVVIGSQTWMAENLNFDAEGSKCYDNNPDNCVIYGKLYDWATAMNNSTSSAAVPSGVRGVCPSGWHLPSLEEWKVMTTYIGGAVTEGDKLKATSGWNDNGNGTDNYGFSALSGGYSSLALDIGYSGIWWSTTENEESQYRYPYGRLITYDNSNEGKNNYYHWSHRLSVRCVKD